MLLHLSWKNIWRNKGRTFVIVAAIALGLWGSIFSTAFMNGMSAQQIYSVIHTETGHIQVNAKGFMLNYDISKQIPNADKVADSIRHLSWVAAVSPAIQMTAMASTATSSTAIIIHAVDPALQKGVSDLSQMVKEGSYFGGSFANPIVISRQLAEKLHVRLRSRIVTTLPTLQGDITYGAFEVAGIYRTPNSDFDRESVFIRRGEFQQLIGFPGGAASVITVLLHRDDDLSVALPRLQSMFPRLQVQGWHQLSPMVQVLSGTIKELSLLFVGVIMVALAFGIANTMLMAVLDRTTEIGMLLSIGMSPRRIFRMITLETLLLSMTGAAIGILLSIATIAWFGHAGIDLSAIGEGANALGYSSMVYPSLGPLFYLQLGVLVILLALVAGFFPAWRATRLKPATAIRGE